MFMESFISVAKRKSGIGISFRGVPESIDLSLENTSETNDQAEEHQKQQTSARVPIGMRELIWILFLATRPLGRHGHEECSIDPSPGGYDDDGILTGG